MKQTVVLHATLDEHGVEQEDAEPDYTAEFDADDAQMRPCAYCGRPVPQRASAGRPFRYCRDNEDACLKAARNARMRQRNAPGLAGQVAQAFELADRLERALETLTDSLHGELSPAGVDRTVTTIRAETAAALAAAQAERDEARREAEDRHAVVLRATNELARVRADSERTAQAALGEAQAARALAAEAVALADERVAAAQAETRAAEASAAEADARTVQAHTARDEARRAVTAAEALRTDALRERDEARAAIAEAVRARDEAQTEARLQAAAAQEAAARAEVALAEAAAVRRKAEAETEAVRRMAGAETETVRKSAEAEIASIRQVAESARREADAEMRDLTERLRSAQQGAAEISARLAAADAERETARRDKEAAQAHAAQLAEQVGQLAAALARLGRDRV
jgi:hypothetical protein